MPAGVVPTGDSGIAPVLCDACLGRVLLPSATVIVLERVFPALDLEVAPSTSQALQRWLWENQEASQTGALFGLILKISNQSSF